MMKILPPFRSESHDRAAGPPILSWWPWSRWSTFERISRDCTTDWEAWSWCKVGSPSWRRSPCRRLSLWTYCPAWWSSSPKRCPALGRVLPRCPRSREGALVKERPLDVDGSICDSGSSTGMNIMNWSEWAAKFLKQGCSTSENCFNRSVHIYISEYNL